MSGLVEILSSQLPPLLGLRTDSPIGKEGVALSAGPPPLPSSHRRGRSRPGYSKLRLTAADMVGNRDRYRFLPLGHALDVCALGLSVEVVLLRIEICSYYFE
jgi:hypothetical protein